MLQALEIALNVAIAVFIAGALLTAGLEVSLAQVLEPLKNLSSVIRAVIVNVVLVPLLTYAMVFWFALETPYMIGLLLYGVASGAPYTPRLVAVANADVSSSIGLTMLLTVLTILYMPLVLPFLVPGTHIAMWDIAKPLLLQMFVPLMIGLGIHQAHPALASKMRRPANVVVNLSAVVFLCLALVLHYDELAATIGKGAITSAAVLTLASFALGFVLAEPGPKARATLGLVTTARNIGAAATIATANFGSDRRILITVAVCMFVVFAFAFPAARLYFRPRLSRA